MTKTILVTGSSSGLGRATVKHFHAKGWNVVATMRNPEREEELIRLDRVLVTRLDVQDLASIQAAVDGRSSRSRGSPSRSTSSSRHSGFARRSSSRARSRRIS